MMVWNTPLTYHQFDIHVENFNGVWFPTCHTSKPMKVQNYRDRDGCLIIVDRLAGHVDLT